MLLTLVRLAIGASLALWAPPKLLSFRNDALMRQQALLMERAKATCAIQYFNLRATIQLRHVVALLAIAVVVACFRLS